MHRISMAMTITMMIIMTKARTISLRVAAVFLLLVRHSHHKSLAFCGRRRSKQNFKHERNTRATKNHEHYVTYVASARKNTLNKNNNKHGHTKGQKHRLLHGNHTQSSSRKPRKSQGSQAFDKHLLKQRTTHPPWRQKRQLPCCCCCCWC